MSLDEILHLSESWVLHHGDRLANARVAFRVVGPAHAPVVAALGGISAHRGVAGAKGEAWWSEVVGPGLALDTLRFRVLGIDYIGGAGDSSTPDGIGNFPPVSAYDQAVALQAVVAHLKLDHLHAIVGASYGGMVALAFAERFPALVRRLVVLSAADRAQALSTAWRSVQRQIVREAIGRGEGASGLRLARALAMTTYRSAGEFAERFSAAPVRVGDRFRFPVEEYLFARGDRYVQRYRPESFLTLSESIDLFTIDAAGVSTPATLFAVRQDLLVPLADIHAFAGRLGGRYKLFEIDSMFGHDAFLKEGAALKPIIDQALTEAT
ncbi:MAG: homoserine O-succinyltransferase [Steroidobacteraceae bacterium]